MMGAIVAGPRSVEDAFALLAIIADPARAKGTLERIVAAGHDLDVREAALVSRETSVSATELAQTAKALEINAATRIAAEGKMELARIGREQEAAHTAATERLAREAEALKERAAALDARERTMIALDTGLVTEKRRLTAQAKALEERQAALDARAREVAGRETALVERRARIEEAVRA